MNAKEMVDVRFVMELDDTDFIQSLDKKQACALVNIELNLNGVD